MDISAARRTLPHAGGSVRGEMFLRALECLQDAAGAGRFATGLVAAELPPPSLMPGLLGLAVGGVLVLGDRGTGKSTAVRALAAKRAGQVIDLTLTPNRRDIPKDDGSFETRWMIGLTGGMLFEPQTRRPGLLETGRLALDQAWFVSKSSLSGLWHVVSGQISSCNLSGPVGMAQVMGDAARLGVEEFLGMLAMLSLGVGLLNLFPIPILDGGHLMAFAYEAVTRRAPAPAVMNVLYLIGLFVVLSFMFFATFNDAICK